MGWALDEALGSSGAYTIGWSLYEGPSCVAAAAEAVNGPTLKSCISALYNPDTGGLSGENQTFIQRSGPKYIPCSQQPPPPHQRVILIVLEHMCSRHD